MEATGRLSRETNVNIYVGNLAYGVTEEQLREAFGQFGEVENVSIIMDRMTGRSKGFGFVEMQDNSEAEAAIRELNEQPIGGRAVRVNEARPREERPRRPGPPR
jgi:RNA recognition motif-containing protein